MTTDTAEATRRMATEVASAMSSGTQHALAGRWCQAAESLRCARDAIEKLAVEFERLGAPSRAN